MNGQNPLDQLRDVHAPQAISWFPMAIGWWILLAFALVVIVALIMTAIKRYKANQYKREAFRQLILIEQKFQESNDSVSLAFGVLALLKRVALFKLPRTQVASTIDGDFGALLMELSSNQEAAKSLAKAFDQSLYSKSPTIDTTSLLRMTKAWIGGVK